MHELDVLLLVAGILQVFGREATLQSGKFLAVPDHKPIVMAPRRPDFIQIGLGAVRSLIGGQASWAGCLGYSKVEDALRNGTGLRKVEMFGPTLLG